MKPRDRQTSKGLLPRMEARPWGDGKTITYRYHPLGGKPINLGTDRTAAIQRVLDLNRTGDDKGTIGELWRLYRASDSWGLLSDTTRADYEQCAEQLLKRFAKVRAAMVRPADVNRYLRVERGSSPVRANREVAVLANLFNLAIERGDMDANPCKQVRRNKEKPRRDAPTTEDLAAFVGWLEASTVQRRTIAHMAEFAAYAGARRVEFRGLTIHQIDRKRNVIRVQRAKQRGVVVWDEIAIGEQMADLLGRMVLTEGNPYVFRDKFGNAYKERAFKTMWSRVMALALESKIVSRRFTFHDLRAYYATTHKTQRGTLPDMHKNPATTASIYDRNKTVKRGAL